MTEQEAIKELQYHIDSPFGIMVSEETCKLAINALEKQIAEKIVINNIPKTSWTKATTKYTCPSCDRVIGFNGMNYCPTCGQRLNWSEV